MGDGILPADLEWLERKANRARSEVQWFTVPEVLAGDEEQFSRLAEKWRAKEERYRRILAALTAEPSDYLCELEDIISDALHTLENEKASGTAFDEPGWVDGTLSALRSIAGTMEHMRSLRPPSDVPPP